MSDNFDRDDLRSEEEVDYTKFYLGNYREESKTSYDYEVIEADGYEVSRLKAIKPDLIDSEPYHEPHIVEKVTSVDTLDTPLDNRPPNKSPKTKKEKRHKFAIVLISILLCCGLVLLIADSLTDGYILDTASKILLNKSTTARTYYAVEIASFTDLNSAKVCSNEVRGMNGAGYVINDELFRVIADAYHDKKDAMSVSSKLNISGYLTKIYVIDIMSADYSALPMQVRNPTKQVLGYYDKVYTKLHEVITNIELKNIESTHALTEIGGLYDEMKKTLVDYETNVEKELNHPNVVKVRVQIEAVIGGLENLKNTKAHDVTFLSDIRYISIMVLNTHRAMIASLT